MAGGTRLWLGTTDKFARLRRIESLDPEADFREIVGLFYQDFQSVMLLQGFFGFMMTYASPRISRILAGTGELERRVAKRIVDTILLSRLVMEHGFAPGPGRDAARRVNAMHRQYDIHDDDFVAVGCDEALCGLDAAERFGWRPVSDAERRALRNYYDLQSRAYGSRRPLPATIDEMHAFWSAYLDEHARFEPQNARLAEKTLAYFIALLPFWLRRLGPALFLSDLDPRITRACGLRAPSPPVRRLARAVLAMMGKRDPVPDGAADGMAALVAQVYPDGWQIDELGTHIRAKPPLAAE